MTYSPLSYNQQKSNLILGDEYGRYKIGIWFKSKRIKA